MAKRISSIFSLSLTRDDKAYEQPHAHASHYLQSEPSANPGEGGPHKLHKHSPAASSDFSIENDLPPLMPPPFVSDEGVFRPPSSQRSGPDSRLGSRASSPASLTLVQSREESRSRPQTPVFPASPGTSAIHSAGPPSAVPSGRIKKKSWALTKPGGRNNGEGYAQAWIAGLRELIPYDLTPLMKGEKVPEAWSDQGDTLIYLYPPSSKKGPCFKVHSSLLMDSKTLVNLRFACPTSPVENDDDLQQLQLALAELTTTSQGIRPSSQASSTASRPSLNFSVPSANTFVNDQKHVYLPLGFDTDLSLPGTEPQGNDLELVVLYRNFFAFLAGGALVATPRQVTVFSIMMGISTILKRFSFTNSDGSTFGEVPTSSFARYCEELRLGDVRSSREKTIEAIVLGEQLRSWLLYNEGFTHAVGKLADIKAIKSPKFEKITSTTVARLERAQLELEQKLVNLTGKLNDFDFPSMFAGIANSQSSTEAKMIRFKEWKAAFLDLRKFTLSYYRRRYGSWPPKASSKKNNFEENGLNRVLLKELYKDFTDLYDILVDRTSPTTRTANMPPMADDAETSDLNETIQHAIRRVESEYDRATPPVLPPMPFDTPLLPQFSHSFNRTHVVISDKTALQSKKLRENEVNEVLLGSYNRTSINASPFIQEFFGYERRLGHGKVLDQIVDARCGQWLFLYAVLQALPLVVVDARNLKYTDGVEYFLCIAPRGRPWMKEDSSGFRSLSFVDKSGVAVDWTAEQIDQSVETIYARSHCWTAATAWVHAKEDEGQQVHLGRTSSPRILPLDPPIAPPQYLNPPESPYLSPYASPLLRPSSPTYSDVRSVSHDRSSVSLGLEPAHASASRSASRPTSTLSHQAIQFEADPNMTFDTILGTNESPQKTKGKKGKK
ncbi:hypothetical protein PV08_03277 [Exophiala spinifera]|uniref:DUF8004 domain-containing protein n=1 Tax=Exophiala spinifera TaxID=91928 RepID=A0A0D2BJB5_9EURO|nr:uncharacterized protein PV08_03277 [Exophiala spinifera]KIW18988.1 hypothetical protein PV08_03277 [Exophiala spinifera]